MARNKKVEILSHSGEVLHPITDGDCVIFPDGETLTRKLSEQEEVMYTPEVVNSSPMFKVGEGDSSDYSANVLDGAYQEAVLKGQTYVNTIQEPSPDVITLPTPFTEYERTQSKTFTEMQDGTFGLNLVGQSYVNCIQEPSEPSYVALGENLEFQNKKVEYTSDGQIKSAMLNGMTLVNWCTYSTKLVTLSREHRMFNLISPNRTPLQQNKDYLIVVDVISLNTPVTTLGLRLQIGNTYITIADNRQVGLVKYKFNTGSNQNLNGNNLRLYITNEDVANENFKCSFRNVMILEYQEGLENIDIPYFQGMQSVTMTTELENVCSRYNSSAAKNGKTFTVGSTDTRTLKLSPVANIGSYNFKQNTKYLLQFKIANLNLDGLDAITFYFSEGDISGGNALFGNLANASMPITKNGIYRIVLTTSNIVNTSGFVIKGIGSQWENSTSTSRTLTISQIMCIEYQNGMENWDLPYFEATQLMKPIKVQSTNKNLFNINDIPSSISGAKVNVTNSNGTITVTSKSNEGACYTTLTNYANIKLKKGVNYRLSCNFTTSNSDANATLVDITNNNALNCPVNDSNSTVIRRTYCPTEDVTVCLRFYAATGSNGKNGGVTTYTNIQLEESSTATDYVPHQSKTISALEPITLRAIGNVKDTLDLSTGEYVQRIGEIVLDGSESWSVTGGNGDKFYTNIVSASIKKSISMNVLLIDKFRSDSWENIFNSTDIYDVFGVHSNGNIEIRKQNITTVEEMKTLLSQNPIKIQYQLANPITRKISLEYPNLQTYTDITHVQSIAMDGTLIPNIYLPSDISYKAMLKPNTSYNVIIDREVIDSTNQLTVNLGGTTANITANRTVVRTPSTLSNETLTFSGKDNRLAKAMLIEGSTLINGDLPHFDGIGDVKLGRVVENLCMANESYAGSSATTNTLTNNEITCKVTSAGSRVVLFDFTKPIQNGKKYFVYAPCSKMFAIGIRTFYNSITYYDVAKTNITNYAILSVDNSILNDCKLFIGQLGAMEVNSTMTIRRPIVCEYIKGMENWDWESIGYFTGTKNIGNEFMRIGNKNLFDLNAFKDKIKNESCFTILDNGFKADSSKGSVGNFLRDKYKFAEGIFKENTQYTISFDTTHEGNLYLSPFVAYTDGTSEGIAVGGNGKRTLTTAINKTVKLFSVTWSTQANGGKSTLTNIQIEEASSATSYVAHKHNSLHILPNEQIPLTFVQGGIYYTKGDTWANAINNTATGRIRTQLLDLEPNETYRISCGHGGHNFGCQAYDNNLLGMSDSGWVSDDYYFTTTKDVHKYAIVVKYKDDSNITPSVLHQVRLEKVKDVTLRSVGDVKDELDLTRGVYIQRIGEIVIDGNGNYTEHINTSSTHYGFRVPVTLKPKTSSHEVYPRPIISDKLPSINYGSYFNGTAEGVSMYEGESTTVTNIYISFDRNRINMPQKENNINHVKNYCKTHPMIVQYVLETPIEHKINIPMKNESNQTIAKPNGIFTLPLMYSETNHVDINSQIYPKVQSRDYISYPVIASPSNKYTVFHNKVGSTDLTVNLCGASTTVNTHKNTITTPSTISQYELRLSGATNKVSNVCVFNGDYMNVNVPYVQGMMNAVNPTVKNTGKNLFVTNRAFTDKNVIGTKCSLKDNVFTVTGTAVRSGGRLELYNYKEYISFFFEKGKKYSLTIDYTSKNNNIIVPCLSWGDDGTVALYISNPKTNPDATITAQKSGLVYFGYNVSDGATYDCQFRIQLEEASTSSQYEEYKENNCKPDYGQIKLTKDMFEQGSFNELSSVKNYYETKTSTSHNLQLKRIRLIDPIPVKPNTKYIVKFNGLEDYDVFVAYFKDNERVGFEGYWKNKEFTTPSDCNQIVFVLKRKGDAQILVDDIDYSKLIFSKVDETIHLRSLPNGVHDELNLETGEYIQRVGEVVLDGSEDEAWSQHTGGDKIYYATFAFTDVASLNTSGSARSVMCDKLTNNYTGNSTVSSSYNKYSISCLSGNSNGFAFSLDHTTPLAEAKLWLQANPITVQYQLKTPIIKHVDVHNYPHSYKDGHVIIENNDPTTSIPAQLTYKCVTNRSGQIQEHTEQVEKQERQINELETLILENIRQNQNRSQNFLTSLISTLEIEEE